MFFGIRGRLVGTYLIIIILTVAFFEVLMLWAVNTYYMDNINKIIQSQAETAGNFYSAYLANTDVESNSNKLIDNFSGLPLQIQITDAQGKVIGDSLHSTYGQTLDYKDVKDALKGQMGNLTWLDSNTKETVLSYSIPLKSGEMVVGTARFTTSLVLTEKAINRISSYLVITGFIIILLIFLISLYISHTIINPVKKITKISDEMAKGNLSVRAGKFNNDEIGILAESLNHMADEIEKNDKLKNEFISSISHELKTPLTSIKGWTSTLMDTKPQEFDVIQRGTYIINVEADRLTEMLDDLLDFSRLQSGKFALRFENVEINHIISNVYEQMNQRAAKLGITMKIYLPEEGQYLKIDKRRVKQILINLVDNALKYTESGGNIDIKADIEKVDDKKFYKISITDTGCGISEENLPLIKNKFYRGDNVSNTSGIGLGLSICNELVNAHGGILSIDSQEGKGTTVSFMLPMKS